MKKEDIKLDNNGESICEGCKWKGKCGITIDGDFRIVKCQGFEET